MAECESLCGEFGIPISRVAPACGDPLPLSEFGDELKQELYRTSFQRDLARVRDSRQASILATLFPPNASYFSYKPLDLMIRVLNGHDRKVRISFLQNLCGTSYLASHFRKNCHFCGSKFEDLAHYILDCPLILEEREKFIDNISAYLSKTDPKLSQFWSRNFEGKNRYNICSILFGGNFVASADGELKLFRKSRPKPHHTDNMQ